MESPRYSRSDHGPEMIAKVLRRWLKRLGTETICLPPGSPWENGYCESFNGKLRDQLLNGEIFLHPQTSPGGHRTLALSLPHHPTAQWRWDTLRQPLKRRHPRRS